MSFMDKLKGMFGRPKKATVAAGEDKVETTPGKVEAGLDKDDKPGAAGAATS